ncbi:MAG: HD-GYP domain-containing protein [Candidatus Dormibacteria bacterium]
MRNWATAGRLLFWAGLFAGADALLGAAGQTPGLVDLSPVAAVGPIVFFLACIIADAIPIKVRDLEFTVTGVFRVATILLFVQPLPVLMASASAVVADVYRRKPMYKVAWNAASSAYTVFAAQTVYAWVNGGVGFGTASPRQVAAIAAMVTCYYVVNIVPLGLMLARSRGRRVIHFLRANLQSITMDICGTLLFGILVAYVWHDRPYLGVILLGIAVVVYQGFRNANRLEEETVSALETIVDLLDQRDPYTYNHSLLVAEYARMVAEELVRDPNQVQIIVRAAYLHDIGKIGVSDEYLQSTQKLSAEGLAKIREHPDMGARILARYSQFSKGREIVLAHQEKYDGTGYPRALRGDEIPMGARIIAVVDAYVAMTTDRPYRRAMRTEDALQELRLGIGTQFDPVVCATFIKLLHESDLIGLDNVLQMENLRDRRLSTA